MLRIVLLFAAVLAILALPISPQKDAHHAAPACFMGPGTAWADDAETLPGSVYEPPPGNGGIPSAWQAVWDAINRVWGDNGGPKWRSVATRA